MEVVLICTNTKPNIITNIQIQIQREVGQIGEQEFDGVVRRMRSPDLHAFDASTCSI